MERPDLFWELSVASRACAVHVVCVRDSCMLWIHLACVRFVLLAA